MNTVPDVPPEERMRQLERALRRKLSTLENAELRAALSGGLDMLLVLCRSQIEYHKARADRYETLHGPPVSGELK